MKIKKFRWWIAVLLGAATAINYLDRQNLPMIINELKASIEITDRQYGIINSIFLFAYGTMYAVGGRIIDKLGTKRGYSLMIVWWSLANMAHGLISSVFGLGIVRFLLGLGEGGGFPGSAKAVSEWFPPKERSFAFGIFNTGSSLGAVIAPPLIAFIILWSNWRWAFFLCGLIGLIWVMFWIRIYSVPKNSKYLTYSEMQYIEMSLEEEALIDQSGKISLLDMFHCRKIWGLLVIKFLTDSAWFFFIFWLPKYLFDLRGLDIKAIGSYAWIPYAFAGCGSFIGGWFSSYLFKKIGSLDISRKIPLAISAAMLPLSLLITSAPLSTAIFLFGLAMFGHQFWSTIVQTLAADMFPSSIIGSVSGLMGCVGTYGAMLFSFVVGFIIESYGYNPVFILAGILHPLSFLLVLVLIRKIELSKVLNLS